MRNLRKVILIAWTIAVSVPSFSQRTLSTDTIQQLPAKYLEAVNHKTEQLSNKIDNTSKKALRKLAEQEARIKDKLAKIDPSAAENIFADASSKYKDLEERLSNTNKLTQYIPFLDTLNTSFEFLEQNEEWLQDLKDGGQKLKEATEKLKQFQTRLQQAENIKQFLKERKQFLKDQLSKFGFVKELKKLNKEVYYYSQQVKEYKELFSDPKKIEKKAIEILAQTKLFRDFMKKNSMLASLFRMPADDPNDPANMTSLQGLQTRSQVNALIQNTIAAGGAGAQQQVSNNIQSAQSQLQQLKNNVAQFDGNGSNDELPDFKPNNQKTKSFLKRLEFGTNMQTQRARNIFPVTTDLGLSVGYKLNDKSIIGVGASYKMGWGSGWRNIDITHQGVGLRSFVDWKLRGSFYMSGGYEMNYRNVIRSVDLFRERSAWQESGLIGLSKIVSVKSKMFNKMKVQMMWDFLSYRQVPNPQPFIFRFNYSIK